jgi:Fur family peroxide stress response transcriptional regulator
MQLQNTEKRLEQFKLECKKHKLKITPQRVAIYRKLLDSYDHPTADDVFQAIREEFSNISYDTVNRTLLSLAEIGLIDIVKSPGGARRFDPDAENHHHLHCVKCGKIIDFHSEVCDKLKIPDEIKDHFTVFSKRVVLNGICKECNQKSKAFDS